MKYDFASIQNKLFNHWKILGTHPLLAYEMIIRPLPTQGLQALGTLLLLGFRKFYIIGMDFYQNTGDRYYYKISTQVKKGMEKKDFKPGYEKGAHSFEKDLHFFKLLQNEFPDAQFYSLSEKSFLNSIVPISPIQEEHFKPLIENNNRH